MVRREGTERLRYTKMDRQRTIELLKQKSKEAVYVASLPYNNNEHLPWRRNIEDILEMTFGETSTEYKRVKNTSVDIISKATPASIQHGYVELVHRIQQEVDSIIQKYEMLGLDTDNETNIDASYSDSLKALAPKTNWKAIENEFGVTKIRFGQQINFIKDPFKRTILFRDVEHAFVLASLGYPKPAVILAGGVIEELLRLYLKHRNIAPINESFDGYIQTCEQKGLLKAGISRLSDSARHFRNLVHLSAERTKKHTISKAAAVGAVSSIFTIANDF